MKLTLEIKTQPDGTMLTEWKWGDEMATEGEIRLANAMMVAAEDGAKKMMGSPLWENGRGTIQSRPCDGE